MHKAASQLESDADAKSSSGGWFWPIGVLVAGVAGAAAFAVRGCWHRSMSWPVRSHRYSYQVCTTCGVKRLFDEHTFRGYGPYGYDLEELIAAATEDAPSAREKSAPPSKLVALPSGRTVCPVRSRSSSTL